MKTKHVVLLTGGTGTLGNLAAAALLREIDVTVVAPVRSHHDIDAVEVAVKAEFDLAGGPGNSDWRSRLHQVSLPPGCDDVDGPDTLVELDYPSDILKWSYRSPNVGPDS